MFEGLLTLQADINPEASNLNEWFNWTSAIALTWHSTLMMLTKIVNATKSFPEINSI